LSPGGAFGHQSHLVVVVVVITRSPSQEIAGKLR
jgi:hypothetical protein